MVTAGSFVLVLLLPVLHGALVVFHFDPGATGRVEGTPDHDERARHRDPVTDDGAWSDTPGHGSREVQITGHHWRRETTDHRRHVTGHRVSSAAI